MGISGYSLHYHEDVARKDIPKISASNKKKIKSAIEKKLLTEPETFGKPLRRSLKASRKLRVGDYRVIFRIRGKRIYILLIAHRSQAYKVARKRIQP
jgi:mRNA interferase RelE/StbE